MPKLSDIAPGRFLSAEDLGDKPEVVTIDTIADEEVFNRETNKKEMKTAMWLEGHERGVIIGAERRNDLIEIYGNVEWDDLAGKAVELYTNKERGRLCIRIRKPGSTPATPSAPAAPAKEPAKAPILNPSQASLKALLMSLWSDATNDDRKKKMIRAGQQCLGKDYTDWDGKDWLELTPVQLSMVENQLREDKSAEGGGGAGPMDDLPF